MTDLNDLARRCEEGSGGDREMDAIIWCAVEHPDQRPQKDFFYTAREEWGYFTTNQPLPGMTFHDAPHLTSSLDAAVSFVERALPLCEWEVTTTGFKPGATVIPNGSPHGGSYAASPARALMAAALRALAHKDLSHDE